MYIIYIYIHCKSYKPIFGVVSQKLALKRLQIIQSNLRYPARFSKRTASARRRAASRAACHQIWRVNHHLSSWWFQPIWKICSSIWIISRNRDENKNRWNHHLVVISVFEEMRIFAFTKLISRWFVHPKTKNCTKRNMTLHRFICILTFWNNHLVVWQANCSCPRPCNTTELTAAGLIQQIRQISTTHALQKTNTVDRSHHCAVSRKFSGKILEELWNDYDLRGKVGVWLRSLQSSRPYTEKYIWMSQKKAQKNNAKGHFTHSSANQIIFFLGLQVRSTLICFQACLCPHTHLCGRLVFVESDHQTLSFYGGSKSNQTK